MHTILVVEDEVNLQQLYEEEFRDEGYQVVTATTGEEALNELRRNDVDLVILDLKLPGMGGVDTLREMLSEKRDVKVVINTAYPSYKFDFNTWGADAFLVKSSDLTELKSTVREILTERPF